MKSGSRSSATNLQKPRGAPQKDTETSQSSRVEEITTLSFHYLLKPTQYGPAILTLPSQKQFGNN